MSAEKSTNDPIVIGMGFDANYAKHAGVTIASIVTETRSAPVEFVIVHEGVGPELQKQVEACGRGAKFTWFEISNSRLLRLPGIDHISRATFFRFALTEVLPLECKRIIYLDCDLITLRDLGALWSHDLKGAPLAAAIDPGIDPDAFANLWDLSPNKLGYFNAGVLVLDIAQIRAEGLFDRAVSLLEAHWNKIKWLDQDALNVIMWETGRLLMSSGTCRHSCTNHKTVKLLSLLVHAIDGLLSCTIPAFESRGCARTITRTPGYITTILDGRLSSARFCRRPALRRLGLRTGVCVPHTVFGGGPVRRLVAARLRSHLDIKDFDFQSAGAG